MKLVSALLGFGLRQVIGEASDRVAHVVTERFTDHSQALPRALALANDRAWQALGLALAGDGFLDQVKLLFATGDDRGIREQVRQFLAVANADLNGTPADFRKACLTELRQARRAGLLSADCVLAGEAASQAATFLRFADPQGLIDGAWQAVAQVADELAPQHPNLARLLRQRAPAGPPLLVSAFAYFFRRQVETNDELSNGLMFDGLRQLSATQARSFAEAGRALEQLGCHFDEVLDRLEHIESAVEQTLETSALTRVAVLDLQADLHRLGSLQSGSVEELRGLLQEVLGRLSTAGMQRGEVSPRHSFSIHGDEEKRAVKGLLARYRRLPEKQQRELPALLNGLGKLQVGTGDFEGAEHTFAEVARSVTDAAARAEAHYNAYRAALEQRKWDEALTALQAAVLGDPGRFAPFPFKKWAPERILGAGGFGVAFLCSNRYLGGQAVLKALHVADLDRSVSDIFREAHTLSALQHPAIITVKDCDYADAAGKRPYLVMEYFEGRSLEEHLAESGPLPVADLLAVVRPVADALRCAHARGILHRDIKPENLLVRCANGTRSAAVAPWQVKLIDFGLALHFQTVRSTAPGLNLSILGDSVAGTLEYAAPEQMGRSPGVAVGPHSDIYSFARLCCKALFNTVEPRRRHWSDIPEPLADLLERCLEHDAGHRPRSFDEALRQLDTLTGALTQEPLFRDLVRAAYRRGVTADDKVRVQDFIRDHHIPRGRAQQIIDEVKTESAVAPTPASAPVGSAVAAALASWSPSLRTAPAEPAGRPAAIVVARTGPADYRTITEAIRNARPNRRIVIRPGVYAESLVLDVPVELVGDGPASEIVIESADGNCILMSAEHAVVRGLTIRGKAGTAGRKCYTVHITRGCLELMNCRITSESLACVAVQGALTLPLIRGCTIHDSKEGGVFFHKGGGGKLEECDIYGNHFGGVEIADGADPLIRGCTIHDGKGGGVVVHNGGRGTFESCDIFGNRYAGVQVSLAGNPSMHGCKIREGNGGGVMVHKNGKGTFVDCDISGNRYAGVQVSEAGDPTVRSCRINRNHYLAVWVHAGGLATVRNCDLTGNQRGAWHIEPGCVVEHSDNKE